MSLGGLLALVRISLLPTALADAIAGVLLAHGGAFPGWSPFLLQAGASLGVYHGALALNDWADREHDARTRPTRPIPSGSVPAAAALIGGLGLVVAGLACAYQAAAAQGLWMSGVALLALVYTFGGRGPVIGPLLLALCRGGNLAAAAFAAGALAGPLQAGACAAYALYVGCVARLGRFEDGECADATGRMQLRWLKGASAALLLVATLPWALSTPWPQALVAGGAALLAAGGLRKHMDAARLGRPEGVPPAMGAALRRLLVVTACAALATGTDAAWIGAGTILCGYPLSHALRKLAPPS